MQKIKSQKSVALVISPGMHQYAWSSIGFWLQNIGCDSRIVEMIVQLTLQLDDFCFKTHASWKQFPTALKYYSYPWWLR